VLTGAGAEVAILDIDGDRAERPAGELAGTSVLRCDITDEAAVDAAVGSLDRLDILVNNAGIGLVGGIEETAHQDFQRLFRVNVEGCTWLPRRPCLYCSRPKARL
jgi:2-keto-3-deoxy-L-fuconate dehydrogenase